MSFQGNVLDIKKRSPLSAVPWWVSSVRSLSWVCDSLCFPPDSRVSSLTRAFLLVIICRTCVFSHRSSPVSFGYLSLYLGLMFCVTSASSKDSLIYSCECWVMKILLTVGATMKMFACWGFREREVLTCWWKVETWLRSSCLWLTVLLDLIWKLSQPLMIIL